MKKEFQDKIDDYLLSRLSAADWLAFEQEANCDSDIHEQLSFTNDVRLITKSRNEKLARMKEWKEDSSPEGKDEGVTENPSSD